MHQRPCGSSKLKLNTVSNLQKPCTSDEPPYNIDTRDVLMSVLICSLSPDGRSLLVGELFAANGTYSFNRHYHFGVSVDCW